MNAAGAVYYTERDLNLIRTISPDGTISTLAVDGLSGPMGLAFDRAGNLYVGDTGTNTVRKIAFQRRDDDYRRQRRPRLQRRWRPRLSASLNGPEGIAIDAAGNLYIADTFNHRVRMVAADGSISTYAGNGLPGLFRRRRESRRPPRACFCRPMSPWTPLATSTSPTSATAASAKSRKGVISTIAGNPAALPPRDGMRATAVRLSGPTGHRRGRGRSRLHRRRLHRLRHRGSTAAFSASGKWPPMGPSPPSPARDCNSYSGDGGPAGARAVRHADRHRPRHARQSLHRGYAQQPHPQDRAGWNGDYGRRQRAARVLGREAAPPPRAD